MQITLNLPEELMQHYSKERLDQKVIEALVIEAYRTEKITTAEVGQILKLPSRWAVDQFLKQHKIDLHYDENDLESDRKPCNKFVLNSVI
jgi:predicted HTH domain antitoxin